MLSEMSLAPATLCECAGVVNNLAGAARQRAANDVFMWLVHSQCKPATSPPCHNNQVALVRRHARTNTTTHISPSAGRVAAIYTLSTIKDDIYCLDCRLRLRKHRHSLICAQLEHNGICHVARPGHAQAAHGQIHTKGCKRSTELDRGGAGRPPARGRLARCAEGWNCSLQVSIVSNSCRYIC